MRKRPAFPLSFVLGLFVCSSALFAERELEFAKGLQKLQLFDLSFEQFKSVLADKNLSGEKRIEAELAFAEAYMDAADQADKPKLKDQYLDLAAKQLDEFLKNHPDVPQANDVRYKKAMLQQTRATQRTEILKGLREKEKADPLVKEGEKLFTDSIAQFDAVSNKCNTEMEKISGIARDERLKEKKGEYMEMFLKATNQSAWTHYYWSELYAQPIVADLGKERQQLDQSVAMFKKYVDDYSSFVIALSGRIGIGACYARMGDVEAEAYQKSGGKDANRKTTALKNYELALDEFRRVVQKRSTEDANPFRYHCYYLLAETNKKMGLLEPAKDYLNEAIKQANILIEQLPEDLIFQEASDQKMAQTQLTLKKAMLEKAEAFLALAKGLTGQPQKDAVDKGVKAINDVVKAGGPMSRVATELRNKWAKVLGIKETRTAAELIAAAKQKFDIAEALYANPAERPKAADAYTAAIRAYEDVILQADPDDEAAMVAESWQQMGLSYFKQGRFYEAALAFSRVPLVMPDAPRAADISFASTQLLGHVLDNEHIDEVILANDEVIRGKITSKDKNGLRIQVAGEDKERIVRNEEVKRLRESLPLDHMMDIYVASLKRFARTYPDDKRATEAVFRSADALRAGGRFRDAAELYETIPSHALQYEKACYLAGHCYWGAYLAELVNDASKAKEYAPLWQKGAEKLLAYLKWADEQPVISPEHTRLKRFWMAKSKLRLANIYSYDTVGEYEKALQELDGFEKAYFGELTEQGKVFYKEATDLQARQQQLTAAIEDAKKKKLDPRESVAALQAVNIELEERVGTLKEIQNMPAEIHVFRIKAYAGMGELDKAKAEYAQLEKDVPQYDAVEKSKLSRSLAMGYLGVVTKLKEKKASEAELKKAKDEAATFVMNVPSLNPNLSAADLIWYASRLFDLDHEEDATKVFGAVLAKLEKGGEKYSPQYWDVVGRIASAYEEAERWELAMKWEELLLGWEKVLTLCCRKNEIAKECFQDSATVGDLLQIWESRENRGAWIICLLMGDGTSKTAMAAYKDPGARAKALAAWEKKDARDQAFARFDIKPFDPMRIGISPDLRRRLAFATQKSGKYDQALTLWGSLSGDIPQGTPVWLDAKYNQVLCLLTLKKEDEAKTEMSSILIPYPRLGAPDKPELEQKFVALIKEKFSKENSEALLKAREEALDESKVADEIKKKDREAIEAYRLDKDKKKK